MKKSQLKKIIKENLENRIPLEDLNLKDKSSIEFYLGSHTWDTRGYQIQDDYYLNNTVQPSVVGYKTIIKPEKTTKPRERTNFSIKNGSSFKNWVEKYTLPSSKEPYKEALTQILSTGKRSEIIKEELENSFSKAWGIYNKINFNSFSSQDLLISLIHELSQGLTEEEMVTKLRKIANDNQNLWNRP